VKDDLSIYLMQRTESHIGRLRDLCFDWQVEQVFWTFDEILQSIQRPSYLAYFASSHEEGEWQGLVLVDIGPFSADIMYIYVRPQQRGRGLGWRFLQEVEKAFLQWPQIESMFLEVRVSNQHAIRLYEKSGMQRVGIRKRYYRDGEDAYVFTKKIKG